MRNLSTKVELTIGALAERTGVNVPTIRYYEEIALIPQAKRRSSGHRFYDQTAQEQLSFIRRCRDFGFPIEQVRELISLSISAERDCVETRDIAQAHLQTVRDKMAELRTLERSLARFVKSCTDACAGGPATQCSILKDMATPSPVAKGCFGG